MSNKCAVCVLFVILLLASCSKSEPTLSEAMPEAENPFISEMLSNLTNALVCYDGIVENHNKALDAVDSYLREGNGETEKVISAVNETIAYLESVTFPENTLSGREAEFTEANLLFSDYSIAFSSLPLYRDEYLGNLNSIMWYLTQYQLDDRDEVLSIYLKNDVEVLKNEVKILYVGINMFLLDVDEAIAADYRENELAKLASYRREALPWDNDKAALEAKTKLLFENIEKQISDFSAYTGKLQNEVDMLQKGILSFAKQADFDNFTLVLESWDKLFMINYGTLNTIRDYAINPSDTALNAAYDAIDAAQAAAEAVNVPAPFPEDEDWFMLSALIERAEGSREYIINGTVGYSAFLWRDLLESVSENEQKAKALERAADESIKQWTFQAKGYYLNINYMLLVAGGANEYFTQTVMQLESYKLWGAPWETDEDYLERTNSELFEIQLEAIDSLLEAINEIAE